MEELSRDEVHDQVAVDLSKGEIQKLSTLGTTSLPYIAIKC